jgi:propanol-preferring alcohol dehydrogenase
VQTPACDAETPGFGGLGHLAVQLLRIYTPARVVVLDSVAERVEWATRYLTVDAAYETGADGGVGAVLDETGGLGAEVVLDLVGDGDVPQVAVRMLRKGAAGRVLGRAVLVP